MTLKLNGHCHYCHKPCSGLFCEPKPGARGDSCEVKYARRTDEINEKRKAKRAEKYGNFVPQRKPTKDLIEGVLLKAYRKGTLLNGYERMQIERRLGGGE